MLHGLCTSASGIGIITGVGQADFCFCLFWVGVLFLSFCFLSAFSGTVMAMCCLVENSLWTFCFVHLGFQVKCVAGYWELTIRIGDRLDV